MFREGKAEGAPVPERESVVILSDRSREIICLFKELHRKRQQVDINRQTPLAAPPAPRGRQVSDEKDSPRPIPRRHG
jgi:hypothetical protein